MSDPQTTDQAPRQPPQRAGSREWLGLAVIALPCMLYSMDLTVLNLAVPHLTAALSPTSTQLLWIVDIYGFLVAGFLIPMGTLGDRIGRRRLLLIGAAAFGIASVIAAYANSAEMLIAARAILGVAAATLAPSTLSLLRNMFHDPAQRTFAIGVWIMSFSLGAVIGPLVGGALLERFWWGSVFLIAVPVMILLLIIGPVLLPEFRAPDTGRIDLLSAAMSLAALLSVIHGLKQLARGGSVLTAALAIAAGIAVGTLFIRRQRRLEDPLIDLGLFRAPAFDAALGANTLAFFANFGVFLFVAQYLQLVLGLSPWWAGVWTAPSSIGFVLGALVTPLLARRFSPREVMTSGLLLAAAGAGVLALVRTSPGLATLVAGSVVFALGLAPVITLATDLVVGAAPPERAGAAASISETSSELGGALGIALLGSIGTAVYRRTMSGSDLTQAPPTARDAATDTIGAALAEAARVGGTIGELLSGVARLAFGAAFVAVSATAAGLLLAAAFLPRIGRPKPGS